MIDAPVTGDTQTFVPLLGEEYEVEIAHPPEHEGSGFCWDMTCPCKEDQDNIQTLGDAVQDGLVTPQEADKIFRGKTV